MKLYGDHRSGNCYKVLLVSSLLGKPLSWIDMDVLSGDTQSDEFLNLNPLGKIPALVLDDDKVITESNAIINFMAHNSYLLPTDPYTLAQVQQWQFFEQYSHEPFIAVARFINLFLGLPDDRKVEYEAKQSGGHKALRVMEQQLQKSKYLVGDQPTVADISLFAYTHVATDGGFDLTEYPAILKWLERIKKLPGFEPMKC